MGLSLFDPWTWIRQAHLTGPVGLHFYPLQLPLSPLLVRRYWERGPNGVMVKFLQVGDSNAWVDGDKVNGLMVENADVVRCTNIWQVVRKHLWCMTRVVFWLVFISDWSVTSSSVHFSYKNHSLLLSFLYFPQKHIVRAHLSYLSEICLFNSCILRSYPFTLWLGK